MLESEYTSSDQTTGVKQEKLSEAQSQEFEEDEGDRIYVAIEERSRDPGRDRAQHPSQGSRKLRH
jgi:integrase/recombinase XerD